MSGHADSGVAASVLVMMPLSWLADDTGLSLADGVLTFLSDACIHTGDINAAWSRYGRAPVPQMGLPEAHRMGSFCAPRPVCQAPEQLRLAKYSGSAGRPSRACPGSARAGEDEPFGPVAC